MSRRAGTRRRTHPNLYGRARGHNWRPAVTTGGPAVTTGGPRSHNRKALGRSSAQYSFYVPRRTSQPAEAQAPLVEATPEASNGPASPATLTPEGSTTPGPDWMGPPRNIGRPTVRAGRRSILLRPARRRDPLRGAPQPREHREAGCVRDRFAKIWRRRARRRIGSLRSLPWSVPSPAPLLKRGGTVRIRANRARDPTPRGRDR
jgi:hypothetical protein